MRVAYFVQTHGPEAQVLRLLTTLRRTSPDAVLVASRDPRSSPLTSSSLDELGVLAFTAPHPGRRGYWSLFEPYALAVELLDRERARYDWLVYLSGQDYPVRPLAQSEAKLAEGGCDGYLTWADARAPSSEGRRRQGLLRYGYVYHDLSWPRPLLLLLRRLNGLQPWWHVQLTYGPRWGRRARTTPFGPTVRPYWGSQWTTLSRAAAECVATAARAGSPLATYFSRTICPDEAFAQTVLVNDSRWKLVNDNLRFVDVTGSRDGHPRTLRLADGPALVAGGWAFARKVDPLVDSALIDWLDERLE